MKIENSSEHHKNFVLIKNDNDLEMLLFEQNLFHFNEFHNIIFGGS